ncbi:MAG: protein kinase family protein [Ruminococcus sp.]|nr:protein kinase family protein [Ruminococcus sp.]
MKNNGDIIEFLKKKEYVMLNNNLGEGSFGKTVLLNDPFIDEVFVAKKYEPDVDSEDEKKRFFKSFLDEIKIMYKLNHHNIVRIYNYYAYENILTGFILMEYIDGDRIDDWIEECSKGLKTTTSNDIFIQLIDAFDYLQQHGIIHRDIREGNILIDKNDVVKVIDFGIGKIIQPGENSDDSLYDEINRANSDTLPIEYYNGTYTSITDMFYLAELMNRLLNTSPCPEFKFQHIIDKMMAKKPEDRYASFGDIKKAIDQNAFSSLSVTDEEKRIYTNFANAIYSIIGEYTDSPTFNNDCNNIISKLNTVLSNNIFETYISNTTEVVSAFVNAGYTYNHSNILVEDVANFCEWLTNSNNNKRSIIIRNLINKISNKPVEKYDLPF